MLFKDDRMFLGGRVARLGRRDVVGVAASDSMRQVEPIGTRNDIRHALSA